MEYIDADKLITEIESIRLVPQTSADYNDGRDDMKMMVLDLIDSLRQEGPEVDLKEEFHRWLSKEKEEWGGEIPPYGDYGLFGIARHFYELGKNARKED